MKLVVATRGRMADLSTQDKISSEPPVFDSFFVGTFEVAAKYGLMLFKSPDRVPLVSEEVAISYAIFYHAIQFVPLTLLGFYHLWREKFSLSSAVGGDGDTE